MSQPRIIHHLCLTNIELHFLYCTAIRNFSPVMQAPITEGMFKSISEQFLDYTDEDFAEVEINFDWEIPYIIRSTSTGEVWSPETHVVMLKNLGADAEIMATTCEEYLMRILDNIHSGALLELLDRFTKMMLQRTIASPWADRSEFHAYLGPALLGASLLMGPLGGLGIGAAVAAMTYSGAFKDTLSKFFGVAANSLY